ncbi:MAG: hypothetical protein WCP28_18870 [Actinomycetes bacterium]
MQGYLNGRGINAFRVVSRNGNCTMRILTVLRGQTKVKFKITGRNVAYITNTVTVQIK